MSRKTYEISTRRVGTFSSKKKDSSFALCLCTMLVILVICSLLLLLSFSLRKMSSKKEFQDKRMFERITNNRTTQKNEEITENPDNFTTQYTIKSTKITQETTEYRHEPKQTTMETTRYVTKQSSKIVAEIGDSTESTTTENISTTNNEEKNHVIFETTPSEVTDMTITSTASETISDTSPIQDGTTIASSDTDSTSREDVTRNSVVSSTETRKSEELSTLLTTNDERFASPSTTEKSTTIDVVTETIATTPIRHQTLLDSRENETTTTSERSEPTTGYEKIGKTSAEVTTEENKLSRGTTGYTTEEPTTFYDGYYAETIDMDSSGQEVSKESYQQFNMINFKDKDTCTSEKCNKEAARIISSMKTSEKACNDFYNYACGGILVDKEEGIDIFRPELFEMKVPSFLKKFHTFYHSCRNYEDSFIYKDRIKVLFEEMRKLYGYEEIRDINLFLANMILVEAFPFLEVNVGVNPINSSLFILELRKPKYKNPNLQYWSSFSGYRRKCLREMNEILNSDALHLHNEYLKCQLNYTDLLATVTSLRGENNSVFDFDPSNEEIVWSAKTVSEWLTTLSDESDNTNYELDPLTNVGHLQDVYPLSNLSWEKVLSFLIDGNVTKNTPILVADWSYLLLFKQQFDNMTERELINFLNVIALEHIYENIVLQSHIESRTEFCKGQTKYMMPDIVNYLYKSFMHSKLDGEKQYIKKMFNHFKRQFNSSLKASDWIDEVSKIALIKKLNGLKLSLFKAEDLIEEEKHLNGIERNIMENNYALNLMSSVRVKNEQKFSLHGQEVTAAKVHRYFLTATEESPLYIDNNGMAYIPFGLIQKASNELPDYLVVAQVGFPLAKVIGKAFSFKNILSIMKENLNTSEKYNDFVNRMRNDGTFSKPFKFNNKFLHFKTSSKPFLDELIADNIAMRILTDRNETFGMQSLLPWISYEFSREKIFFLGLTQEFCRKKDVMDAVIETYQNHVLPPPLKVDNILSHSEEFSRHFDCDNNSPIFRPILSEPMFMIPILPCSSCLGALSQ